MSPWGERRGLQFRKLLYAAARAFVVQIITEQGEFLHCRRDRKYVEKLFRIFVSLFPWEGKTGQNYCYI